MNPGELNERVSIQVATNARDSHTGGMVKTWSTEATRWASVESLSGSEQYRARQVGAESTLRVRMRSYADLTPRHQLLYGTRVLDIETIEDDGRIMTLTCKEIL